MAQPEAQTRTRRKTASNTRIQPRTDIKKPSMYRVIYINDEVTTVDFVIETLMMIFQYEREAAEMVTMEIHAQGSAVVAVMPYEMAEQKGVEVTLLARTSGFPLQVRLEPTE
jgi:ATP-dependent Clp protease adaptor protein ClpS